MHAVRFEPQAKSYESDTQA